MTDPFYITTPIYYVNAEPHVGHAYTTIAADALARARRLAGHEVFFLTGTDEHGQNIERIARERGVSKQQHCDEISATFRALWRTLDIRYDRFIRPSELAAWLRDAGLVLRDVTGLHYNPLARSVMLGGNVRVNYLAHAEKPAA